jgi:hypothetical protein
MSRAVAKRLVRRDVIEAASALLLARFLAPWATFFATRSIALDALVDASSNARTRLYELLARGDAAMPSDLRQELVDLDAMATVGGHDQLLAALSKLSDAAPKRGLVPVDFALTARLEHVDAYRAARVCLECSNVTRYVDYEPRSAARFSGFRDKSRIESMSRTLGAWFESRNRTSYCDVFVVESHDEVLFEITHGEPPRAHGLLDERLARRVERLVITRRDHAIIKRSTGRLQIHARYANEKETYRRVIGEVFFESADHYAPTADVDLSPFTDAPARALSSEGIAGLESVRLRAIELALPGGARVEIKHPESALSLLMSDSAQALFRAATAKRVTLDLDLRGRSSPVRVELTAAGGVHFDRSDPAIEAVALELFERRKILPPRAREVLSDGVESTRNSGPISEAG